MSINKNKNNETEEKDDQLMFNILLRILQFGAFSALGYFIFLVLS